jgi:RNA polymerase sigma-70 factor (ECF subfamily)
MNDRPRRRPPEPADPESTQVLLERIRRGDRAALEILYARYLPRLRLWATGRIPGWARDMGDTEDLVQETVIATLRRIDRFEMRGDGALRGYMRTAILNKVRNLVRDRKARPPSSEVAADEAARGPSPLEQTIGLQTLESYEAALERLNDEERQAVHMRVELRCGYREIAEALDKPSEDAARMAVSRALVKLAKEMGHERQG